MFRFVSAAVLLVMLGVAAVFLVRSDAPDDVDAGSPRTTVSTGETAIAPERDDRPAEVAVAAARSAEPTRAPDEPPRSYLEALGGVIGRIVDHDGTPMPELTVERIGGNVFQLLPTEEEWFRDAPPDLSFSVDATRTDGEGRFRFDGVDPHGFFLLGIDLAGARAAYRPVDRMPSPGEVVDLGDVALDPTATLVGRVVDEDGDPLEGARVRVSELPIEAFRFGLGDVRPGCAVAGKMPGEADWRVVEAPPVAMALLRRLPFRELLSDEDGRFRCEAVPVGALAVLADLPGRIGVVEGPVTTRAGEERRVRDLALFEGETLVGAVVRGDDDEPVAGAEVRVGVPLAIFPVALLLPAAQTDAEGRFEVPGLRDAAHVVAVRAPDATGWTIVERVSPGLDEPIVRLDATHSLTITARDGAGEIVAAPRVLVQAHPDLDLGELGGGSFLLAPPLPVSGRTRTLESGSVRVTGLAAAEYRVLVKADGFASNETRVDLRHGSATEDVTLENQVEASVRVVAAGTGRPIEWALVSAFEVGDGSEPNLLPLVTRRTDANGVVFLDGLTAGSTSVRVFHPAFAIAETTCVVPGPPVVVELSGGGVLSGTVYADGVPIAKPHWVIVISADEGETPMPRMTRTGDAGGYELTHLRAGRYAVSVTDRIGGDDDGDGGGGGGGGIRIGGGPKPAERDDDGGFSFSFNASVGDGPEDDGGSAAPEPVEADEPDGDGFDFGDGLPNAREAIVVEGERTILDVDVKRLEGAGPRGRLLGQVHLNGRPAAGLTVVARTERGGRATRSATTNGAGTFDLGEVPVGRTVVLVKRRSGDGVFAERVVILEAADVEEVLFRITTGELRGLVRSSRLRGPLAYASVSVQAADGGGGAALRTTTDIDGAFRFDDVPAGDYALIADAKGHAGALEGPVSVAANGPAPPVTITLEGSVTVRGVVELPNAAGAAPYVFLYFAPSGDGDARGGGGLGGFAFADPVTRAFELKEVAPGDYAVQVFGAEHDLAPVPLVVPKSGLEGVVMRPEVEN